MSLKNNEITLTRAIKLARLKGWNTSYKVIESEKVKEAVLKFKQRLIDDEAVFNGQLSEDEYCKKYDLNNIFDESITDYFDKVFGYFEE